MPEILILQRGDVNLVFRQSNGQRVRPGPANGEQLRWTAHRTGDQWRRQPITVSDHNDDFGLLYIEGDE